MKAVCNLNFWDSFVFWELVCLYNEQNFNLKTILFLKSSVLWKFAGKRRLASLYLPRDDIFTQPLETLQVLTLPGYSGHFGLIAPKWHITYSRHLIQALKQGIWNFRNFLIGKSNYRDFRLLFRRECRSLKILNASHIRPSTIVLHISLLLPNIVQILDHSLRLPSSFPLPDNNI